jgi:hypothetical protein
MRTRGTAVYYNRTISKAKRSYCVTRRELLAVVKMLEHFYKYLCGPYLHLHTDYSALALLLRRIWYDRWPTGSSVSRIRG